jgi:cysteine desulfurase/selenocysteine lyase
LNKKASHAQFIGAPSDEVIFTRGTTESINLVAYTFGLSQLKEGDEIILSANRTSPNIVPADCMRNERREY